MKSLIHGTIRKRMADQSAMAETSVKASIDLKSASLYLDRELSLLGFQQRVFEEALDRNTPLLERVKFLSILSSNLDEFFMVRVAVLKGKLDPKLSTPSEIEAAAAKLKRIRAEVNRLLNDAYELFSEELVPALRQSGIELSDYHSLTVDERWELDSYFRAEVFPLLTPLAVDQGRPFPHISNLSMNIVVVIGGSEGQLRFARVKLPDTVPRLLPVRSSRLKHCFVWIEEVMAANLGLLFPRMDIAECHAFHVTRDAELVIQELESDDLLETIEDAVWKRRFRAVVRLQVNANVPSHVLDFLVTNLEIRREDIYQVDGPLDLKRLMQVYELDRPELKDAPHTPAPWPGKDKCGESIFNLIRNEDALLHHPYQSFQPVVDFLNEAAADPQVLAIKMTLYRVGRNSPIVAALLEAMKSGKEVAVLLELKARFDEESNIEWAQALEAEGVHVVYGLPGLKVHCKIALVLRREAGGIRRYVHMGTGNYNASTARLYTDLSLFTANEEIGQDATDLFNFLTGYSAKRSFKKLLVAPINMRARLEDMIRREIDKHSMASPGYLVFKMNALEDHGMIELLYKASRAGVKVDLIVRGICCLRPGIPGVSENIQVRSILGRFLEHSRIFYFRNGGQEEIYCGSADMMPRNLNRRVETMFPVENPAQVRRLKYEMLDAYFADSVRARVMDQNGNYRRVRPAEGVEPVDSQAWFIRRQ